MRAVDIARSQSAGQPPAFSRSSIGGLLGEHRLTKAFRNSVAAWRHLVRREAAFRLEAAAFLLLMPLGWIIAYDARSWVILMGSLLLVMIVEVLNTGVEAACNAITREFNSNIKIAKDCGSLAVLLALLLATAVWGEALWTFSAGAAA